MQLDRLGGEGQPILSEDGQANRPVALCCKTVAGFEQAHWWALSRRRTSVLIPRAAWPQLAVLQTQIGVFDVVTDDAACTELQPFSPLPVAMLEPTARPAIRPTPDVWPDPVAVVLTSGSTGAPKPIAKSVKSITGEIALLRSHLRLDSQVCVVSTVPLEHMFGYVFGFWLPHLSGARAYPQRMVLPRDLKNLCEASQEPVLLITTPVHLRACVALSMTVPHVAGVICATSPLTAPLAKAAACCFGVPITEIYGSTEAGAMAYRSRHAHEEQEPLWTTLPGLQISTGSDGMAQCRAPHLDGSVALGDRIALCDTGFTLIGRDDDLVKICGKRHSLAALNALLAATPGVIEASYYFPGATENQSETARPVAFVVLAAEATLQTVLHQLRGRLDDVFLPRPLYQVDILPRSETGKLARPDLTDLYIRCKQRASSGHVTRPDPPRLHEAAPRKIAMDDAPMDASPTPDAGLNQVPLEGRSPC